MTAEQDIEPRRGLIADAKRWWKYASVKVAALTGGASALLVANHEIVATIFLLVPESMTLRIIFAAALGFAVFAVPTIARLWPQEIEDDDADA